MDREWNKLQGSINKKTKINSNFSIDNINEDKNLNFKIHDNQISNRSYSQFFNIEANKATSVSTELNSKNEFATILSNLNLEYYTNPSELIELNSEESESYKEQIEVNKKIKYGIVLQKSNLSTEISRMDNEKCFSLINNCSTI